MYVICDDEQIEKEMFAFKEDDIKCTTFPTTHNKNESDADDETFATSFSVTFYHPNSVKLLGNYNNLEDATGLPSFSKPLCLADWKYFLNKKYDDNLYQLYTLIVYQNVTNGVTADFFNCVKENNVN